MKLTDQVSITKRRHIEERHLKQTSRTSWKPEERREVIDVLEAEGWTRAQQASILGISARQIQHVISKTQPSGARILEITGPKDLEDLPPETKVYLQRTGEGFRAFFNAFSGQTLAAHEEHWVQEFLDHPNLIINTPPRHGKTEVMAVWLPIWLLCRNRDEKVIVVSKTNDGALKSIRKIAINLESNISLIQTFGQFKPTSSDIESWQPNSGQLTILGRSNPSGDPSVLALGSRQQILGREASVLIADDITDTRISESQRENDALEQWFREEALSRIMPGGKAVCIGQRVHFDDLYARIVSQVYSMGALKGQPVWHHVTQQAVLHWPAEEGGEGIVLWPEERPWSYIQDIFARQGSALFETMFQQNPGSGENVIFQRQWFAGCYDKHRVLNTPKRKPEGAVRVLSLDPASDGDNALILVDITRPENSEPRYALVSYEKFRGQLSETQARVDSWITAFRPDYFVFEKSGHSGYAMQTDWFQGLRERVRLIVHKTGHNKNDPLDGLASVSVLIENGFLSIPYGDKRSQEQAKGFVDDLASWYPRKRKGYDYLAALWFIKYNEKVLRPISTEPLRLIPRGSSWRSREIRLGA